MKNIIDKIEALLRPNNPKMDKLVKIINKDPYIDRIGHHVTRDDLHFFFASLLKGFKYMKKKYGKGALPKDIILNNLYATKDGKPYKNYMFIGYSFQDALIVSSCKIAYFALMRDDTKEVKRQYTSAKIEGFLSIEDRLTLIAVEEGYHRYQHKILKMKPDLPKGDTFSVDNNYEQDAIAPVRLAQRELGIKVKPFPKEWGCSTKAEEASPAITTTYQRSSRPPKGKRAQCSNKNHNRL